MMLITSVSIDDWLPPLMVGLAFTFIGVLKLVGLARGIVGGRRASFGQRLCGT